MKYFTMLVLSMLLFVGCSQREPEVTAAAEIETTVSATESEVKKTFNLSDNVSNTNQEIVNYKSIYFDFDQFKIRENQEATFMENFQIMYLTSSAIRLEGNCDEFGSNEYNMALGLIKMMI